MKCLRDGSAEGFRSAVARLKGSLGGRLDDQRCEFKRRFFCARAGLREKIIDDFRRNEWPRLKQLNEALSQGIGLPVPTLSVCGAGTAEIRFTQLLAYFFNARNDHGLGGLLTYAAFSSELEDSDDLDFGLCTAQAEVPLGATLTSRGSEVRNTIDLLIDIDGRKIVVEQKIGSTEGEEQLSRYSVALQRRFTGSPVTKLFLTPDGRSGREGGWRPISYGLLISRMASVLKSNAISDVARHNLKSLLWDLMLGPLAREEKWMFELRHYVRLVSEDIKYYSALKSWLSRNGMGRAELGVLALMNS